VHPDEVVDVLEESEASADGEGRDRRVDHEADALRADEVEHVDRLQRFLEQGSQVAPQDHGVESEAVHEPGIAIERDDRGRAADGDGKQHRAHGHELEAVHEDEECQEGENWDDAERQADVLHRPPCRSAAPAGAGPCHAAVATWARL
jgi:hypothetical protein